MFALITWIKIYDLVAFKQNCFSSVWPGLHTALTWTSTFSLKTLEDVDIGLGFGSAVPANTVTLDSKWWCLQLPKIFKIQLFESYKIPQTPKILGFLPKSSKNLNEKAKILLDCSDLKIFNSFLLPSLSPSLPLSHSVCVCLHQEPF